MTHTHTECKKAICTSQFVVFSYLLEIKLNNKRPRHDQVCIDSNRAFRNKCDVIFRTSSKYFHPENELLEVLNRYK